MNTTTIDELFVEITTKGSIYDEIINNLIQPNFHLKNELISELAISFLENRPKINKIIQEKWFPYYFIRSVKNQIHSKTSPFHKNVRIKDTQLIDNLIIIDESDLERKEEVEELYKLIDRTYTKIPKSYFQEFIWHEYFTKNKTHRQIGSENNISHCLSFHEVKKVKDQIINQIKKNKNIL